jgi:hypothetical protein
MTEQTATAKKGGLRIAIDWIDGDGDAFRPSFPSRGVPPPSASRKGNELARSSHVRGGTCIHINVCLTSPPSSAVKVKPDVFVDARSSSDPGDDDVCFVSPPLAAAAKGKGKRHTAAEAEAEGEFFQGMPNSMLCRFQPSLSRLSPHYEAEARKRKEDAYLRMFAHHGNDVCFVSPPPAAAKGKEKRHTAAAAEGEFFQPSFSFCSIFFNIFNWTDVWGSCPTQQITLFFATSDRRVPTVSFLSIRDQFRICAHCE